MEEALNTGVYHVLRYQGEGSKERDIPVRPAGERVFHVRKRRLEGAVQKAADRLGSPRYGVHGFRYLFSRERYAEIREAGVSKKEAIFQASRELGHERRLTTLDYLGMR